MSKSSEVEVLDMDLKQVAINIEKLRASQKMTQEEFAEKLGISRPTVSNWEKGKAIPTTDQLIRMNEILGISVDNLLGTKCLNGIVLVLDTSVLLRRPRILDELQKKEIERIYITETGLSELNYQKDKGKRHQQAWLALASFNNLRESEPKRFIVESEKENSKLNDDKIINAALNIARKNQDLKVYLLSEDIYFPLKSSSESKNRNFECINLERYKEIFANEKNNFDPVASAEFFSAVSKKSVEEAKKILKRNPNVNMVDSSTGFTPLIKAIRNLDLKMIEFLLSIPEIDRNKCDDSKYRLPPICHAIQLKKTDFVKKLVEEGADIDACSEGKNSGNTALMIASWHGIFEIVEFLVKMGACVNQQDSNGFTPLIKACIQNKVLVAEYLLKNTNSDAKIRSREKKTALDYARKTGNEELIKLFFAGDKNDR